MKRQGLKIQKEGSKKNILHVALDNSKKIPFSRFIEGILIAVIATLIATCAINRYSHRNDYCSGNLIDPEWSLIVSQSNLNSSQISFKEINSMRTTVKEIEDCVNNNPSKVNTIDSLKYLNKILISITDQLMQKKRSIATQQELAETKQKIVELLEITKHVSIFLHDPDSDIENIDNTIKDNK